MFSAVDYFGYKLIKVLIIVDFHRIYYSYLLKLCMGFVSVESGSEMPCRRVQ